jgi:SSS family solute:Na+ symporter
MGVIGGTVLVLSSHGAEQLIVQRVLACKTVADGRKALALSAVVIFPLFLIFLLVGAMLWVFYQGHPFQIPLPETRPGSGITANDFIFPIFMMTEVPHLLKGFLIVAILSAAMSSVSSALTSLASVSTMDFVKHLLPGRSEGFFLRFSKVSTVVWAVVLILHGLSEPPGRLRVERRLRPARPHQRRARRRPGAGRVLEKGPSMPGHHRHDCLPGHDDRASSSCPSSIAPSLWMKVVGTEIFWPWYTLIGATITLLTAWLVRRLLPPRPPPPSFDTPTPASAPPATG